jgi:hypothetical protein
LGEFVGSRKRERNVEWKRRTSKEKTMTGKITCTRREKISTNSENKLCPQREKEHLRRWDIHNMDSGQKPPICDMLVVYNIGLYFLQ